ncbi:hypothetical protein V865_006616 [Kwoniella europaea PYCC6329]|uniref:Amine oxidase domain-containing protein n=1 Tax=Kwoniella europaea PYCC6329 TaxID=1423913 RepID=A0AAX4KR75_9TREE
MKVAVIGSGLAGLTTAYLLRKEGVEVYLIEKSSKLGFHSQSVEIPLSSSSNWPEKSKTTRNGRRVRERDRTDKDSEEKWVVDVPMRGFQGGYYPLLLSLFHHLQIPLETHNYKFSFSSSQSTYFIHSGSSGYSIPSLPSRAYQNIFNLVRDMATFVGVAICYTLLVILSFVAYHDLLPRCLSNPGSKKTENEMTLKEFTSILSAFLTQPFTIPIIEYEVWTPLGELFESFFISKLVIPLFSSVGTMTTKDCLQLPMKVILEYIHLTLGTDHYQLSKGYTASTIAELLAKPIREQGEGYVRLSTEIMGLEYDGDVSIKMKKSTAQRQGQQEGEEEERITVDKVVLATPASVAKILLEGLESSLNNNRQIKEGRRVGQMRAALGKVNYRETIVVTHRDTAILPFPKDRRDLNFFLPDTSFSSRPSPETHPIPYLISTENAIYTQATQIILPPKRLRRRGRTDAMVLQTTNPAVAIDPSKVLSVSKLERALPLKQPNKILPQLRSSSLDSCVYIVGSYAYPGIPLLEGCVGSAKMTVESLLADAYERRTGFVRPILPAGKLDWEVGKGGRFARTWRWRWYESTWR